MAFMKVLKTPAFFKRYQVPKRRRGSGHTDFAARRVMIHQDKNKYNAKKHRLVVRITNTKIICQVVYSTITGDRCVCSANSKELAKFGIPVGHKNYAACYATGLLIARRMLKSVGMDGDFKGKAAADGEEYHVEDEETEAEARPFKAILDVGIRRTCVGARIWGALKGAADGGLHVPHNNKNFPGYKPGESKDDAEYEAGEHKAKIFGEHVKEYMESMQEEDPTKYEAHFAKYIKASIDAEGVEDMYSKAHAKIRADPTLKKVANKGITWKTNGDERTSSDGKVVNRGKKIGLEARRAKVQEKIAAAFAAAADDDEE